MPDRSTVDDPGVREARALRLSAGAALVLSAVGVLWGLVVSPRPVLRVHPFVRGLVELLIALSATIVWWSAGQAWVGLGFGVIAVVVGVLVGRKRLS